MIPSLPIEEIQWKEGESLKTVIGFVAEDTEGYITIFSTLRGTKRIDQIELPLHLVVSRKTVQPIVD